MARRYRSLMFGKNAGQDGIVYHREHRSKHGKQFNRGKRMNPIPSRNGKKANRWRNKI